MKPGIHTVPAEQYHADDLTEQPSLSASVAQILCSRSPLHAWTAHPRLNPDYARQHESRFDVGTCAHAILLEQKPVEEIVAVIEATDWRTKAAREARDEAREAGRIPLLATDVENVTAMLSATKRQLEALDVEPPLFADGKPEQTLIWEEEGVTCRALVDWLRDDHATIDDYKTTSASADPERWTRTLFTIGADVQTAFYLRGLKALTGAEAELRYVVQETYPPYALSVCSLGPDVLAVGEDKVKFALRRWRECIEADEWPGYAAEVCYAELPAWEESRWLARSWPDREAA